MEDVFEHYGLGAINIIGGIVVFCIIIACIKTGGVLNNAVIAFMHSICG